jgi:hypothetical protein
MPVRDEELGPFPQFYLYINTPAGTIRRDIFSDTEALRVTTVVASILTRQPLPDPSPDSAKTGFSIAGNPEDIISFHLYRVNDSAGLQGLPSVDE